MALMAWQELTVFNICNVVRKEDAKAKLCIFFRIYEFNTS